MDCKKKIYLTLIISAIVIAALLLFLVGPLVNKIKSSSGEILKTKRKYKASKCTELSFH